MFTLDSISQQVGFSLGGYCVVLHAYYMRRGVCVCMCVNECVFMCAPREEGRLAKAGKNLV